ncbi:MAG: DUF4199 domain-containing protein [Flavobacteriales bacterium]|nr:DUF4199 domain-containing protein [Flavobacteriales bacterium]|tara:strand:+ start:3057 stop:3593 length:537 start_codon:yes stop_codon:yes gene_type:complete
MKSIVLKYGLIAGLFVSATMMTSLYFVDSSADMSGGEVIGFAGMFIAFSSIFFAIVKYRKTEGNGMISFGKAFMIGLYIALITSTLYVVSWMILSETVFTDFGDTYFDQQITQVMESEELDDAQKEEQIQSMKDFKEAYKNPIYKFFITYVEILPIGLIISLIAAAILKRNRVAEGTE